MDLLGARAKESRNEEPAHPAIAIRAVGGEAEAVLLARLHPPQGQGTEPFGPLGAEHPQQSVEMSDASASQQIDDIVRRTAGWRGERLRRELGSNFEIRYPRMPNEDDPAYAAWKPTLEKELATLDDDAILVGHSLGGTILINALAQSRSERQFGAIFLIAAPFVGDGGWPSEDMNPPPDLGARLPRDVPVFIYHGLDDETAPPSHAELYARAIPQARVRRLPHRDHQLNNDLSEIAATIESLEGGSQ